MGVVATKMAVFGFGLSRPYEPKPRLYLYAGVVGGETFVFGGKTADFHETKEKLSTTIEVFDQYLEQWRQLKTSGSPPKGLYAGGCCVSPSGDLYVYGGSDGSTRHGGLYKLSSLKWSLLGESDMHGPMRKSGCEMVCFNKSKVAIVGGYGPPPTSLQPGASFIKDKRYTDGEGWTNEVHIFDTDKCKWSCTYSSDFRPPRASSKSRISQLWLGVHS